MFSLAMEGVERVAGTSALVRNGVVFLPLGSPDRLVGADIHVLNLLCRGVEYGERHVAFGCLDLRVWPDVLRHMS